jgi:hypothetical protein
VEEAVARWQRVARFRLSLRSRNAVRHDIVCTHRQHPSRPFDADGHQRLPLIGGDQFKIRIGPDGDLRNGDRIAL